MVSTVYIDYKLIPSRNPIRFLQQLLPKPFKKTRYNVGQHYIAQSRYYNITAVDHHTHLRLTISPKGYNPLADRYLSRVTRRIFDELSPYIPLHPYEMH